MNIDRILDTHCHVGQYASPLEIIQEAEASRVGIVAMTESPDEHRRLRTRLGGRQDVEVALGLHPLRASTFTQTDLARFFRLLPSARWLGEVGLDFSRAGISSKRQQLKVFDIVLSEAQPGHHPMSVHSRGAESEVVRLLSQSGLPAILHWYTGPIGLIDDALAAGLYFSFNAAMTRSKRFPSLVRALPIERVLLETDGPYAKAFQGPARPAGLSDVVRDIGLAWAMSPEAIEAKLIDNQRRFAKLS